MKPISLNEIRRRLCKLPVGWSWCLSIGPGYGHIDVFLPGTATGKTFEFLKPGRDIKRDPAEAIAAAIDFAHNCEQQTADERSRRAMDGEIPF